MVLLPASPSLSLRNAQMRMLSCTHNPLEYVIEITQLWAYGNRRLYSHVMTNLWMQRVQKIQFQFSSMRRKFGKGKLTHYNEANSHETWIIIFLSIQRKYCLKENKHQELTWHLHLTKGYRCLVNTKQVKSNIANGSEIKLIVHQSVI